MSELMEVFESAEQLEMTEAMESVEQQEEIVRKLELNQGWYEKALNEGSAEMAEFLRKEIDELKAAQISFEGKLGAHQGLMPEETSEEDDYHQGQQISFGKSIESCEAEVSRWSSILKARTGYFESDIKNGRDFTTTKNNMESAQKQYEKALRELKWAKDHQ